MAKDTGLVTGNKRLSSTSTSGNGHRLTSDAHARVIEFEQVSKRFRLHQERPQSFQEVLIGLLQGKRHRVEDFWALRDVSFEIKAGETVGIIGENGAGKSSILKLISRILEPTSGHVSVHGRVSALLELGAGFHPDLSGRENVFLNGSILGLGRREMKAKFADIVDFAELSRFIDMPVKHYSSGMYMRLAFAIAIHVDPEILLIDEVLAVGDQPFQEKCLERIGRLRRRGVTILFVTHNLGAVQDLCTRALWLNEGHLRADGPVDDVIARYLSSMQAKEERAAAAKPIEANGQRWGSGEVEILSVRFVDVWGNERHVFQTGESMTACMRYRAHQRIDQPVFGIAIHRSDGLHLNGPNTKFASFPIDFVEGYGEIRYTIEKLPLLDGLYEFSATCYDYNCNHAYDHRHRAFPFRVRRGLIREEFGTLYMESQWEHTRELEWGKETELINHNKIHKP